MPGILCSLSSRDLRNRNLGFISFLAATRFGDISHIAGTSDLGDIRAARPDAAKLRTDGNPTICLVELLNRKFANLRQVEDVAVRLVWEPGDRNANVLH